MAVFDLTNLEGWHDVLWAARDAEGPAVWVYFAALVVALNLVALNAFPAIIAFSLRSAIREEENRLGREAKRALGAGAMGLSALEEAAVDMLAAEREDLADVAAALDRAARGGAPRARGMPHSSTVSMSTKATEVRSSASVSRHACCSAG